MKLIQRININQSPTSNFRGKERVNFEVPTNEPQELEFSSSEGKENYGVTEARFHATFVTFVKKISKHGCQKQGKVIIK
ncbi:MAG: hypothetical protein CMI31_12555 [Opitutae bacterium]|nr:hypothetical protein [Opitutae bacterium]|tara:strand:- start:4682 stop:4918 length:237 start_codon:yes stop_codon:yes gene_type:complete